MKSVPQPGQHTADRRLGHPEPLCSARDRAQFQQRIERPQQIEVKPFDIILYDDGNSIARFSLYLLLVQRFASQAFHAMKDALHERPPQSVSRVP